MVTNPTKYMLPLYKHVTLKKYATDTKESLFGTQLKPFNSRIIENIFFGNRMKPKFKLATPNFFINTQ